MDIDEDGAQVTIDLSFMTTGQRLNGNFDVQLISEDGNAGQIILLKSTIKSFEMVVHILQCLNIYKQERTCTYLAL